MKTNRILEILKLFKSLNFYLKNSTLLKLDISYLKLENSIEHIE